MKMRTDGSLWVWRGVWVLALLVALGVSALYARLPADGATGDLESFAPQGYRVQWLLEKREGGLRVGDVIVRAGGHTVDEWLKGAPRGAAWREGGVVTYQVVRDGEPVELEIQLLPVPFRAILNHWGPQLLGAVAFLLVGALVFWKRPRDLAARLLMLFCVSLALQYWGDAYNIQFSALPWRWPFWLHVVYEHGMYGIGIATICYFSLIFPTPHPLVARFPRRVPVILYASFPLFITGAMVLSSERSAALTMGNFASWVVALVQIGLAIAAVVRSVRTARDPVTRAQMRWILWSVGVGATVLIPSYVLPVMFREHPLLSHPVTMVMIAFVPMSIAIAILRYRLFDIEVIINRSLVYGTLTALLGGLYLLLVRVLTLAIQGVLQREDDTLVVFIATLSIALAFAPLRQRVQTLIDRTFYRARPDYQRLAAEMSERLATSIVLDRVASLLTRELPRRLQSRGAALAILDSTGEWFVSVGNEDRLSLPMDHPLVERLRRGRPFLRLQSSPHLPAGVKRFLDQHEIELSVPLMVGKELVGLYNLGPKHSGDPYNQDEVRFLQLLGQQAAVAVENSRLYEQAQQEIAERKRAEEALRGSMTELQNLQQVTETLLRLDELPQVINTVAVGIVDRLGYDMILVNRYLAEEQVFTGLALYPRLMPERLDRLLDLIGRPELRDAPTQYKLSYRHGQNPLIDRVLSGEVVTSDSLADFFHPWVPRIGAAAAQKLFGMQTFVDLPMRVKGETVGTVLVGARQGLITDDQQQALTRAVDQAAVAMENARLYEQAQQEIAERKQAEERILRLQHLLQNIADSMPSALVALDPEGRVLLWNPEAEALIGQVEAGASLWQISPELVRYRDLFERALGEGQVVHQHRDRLASEAGFIYRDVSVFPLITDGVVEGAVLRIDDVTRRVQLEEMMLQSAKMASVGGLAAGVAHEINNPLAVMMQSAQVLQMALDPQHPRIRERLQACGVDPEGLERYLQQRELTVYLGGIRSAGERAAKVVSDMLGFSRKAPENVASHNLNDLMRRTLELATMDYDLVKKYDFRNIEIVHELDADLPSVMCDGQQIKQVLLNLVHNAAQAMAGKMARGDKDWRPRLTLRTTQRDDRVRLEVQDNGPGIPEAVRERLFEPFFTTKDVGEGTGLGLWLCWSIVVERHKGWIWVTDPVGSAGEEANGAAGSGEESGSRFVVELPVRMDQGGLADD